MKMIHKTENPLYLQQTQNKHWLFLTFANLQHFPEQQENKIKC